MIRNEYLELSLMNLLGEDEGMTLHVYLEDDSLIVFNDLTYDPVFSDGWLHVYNKQYSREMTSVIRETKVRYMTYYMYPIKSTNE